MQYAVQQPKGLVEQSHICMIPCTCAQCSSMALLLEGVPIKLSVKSEEGTEWHYTYRADRPFEKLFRHVCLRQSIELAACIFLFDGERLQSLETPQIWHMEDGDIIDVMVSQVGD